MRQFAALQASEEELVKRVGASKGHYMKDFVVASQLAAVEEPIVDETDVLPVGAEKGRPRRLWMRLLGCLGLDGLVADGGYGTWFYSCAGALDLTGINSRYYGIHEEGDVHID